MEKRAFDLQGLAAEAAQRALSEIKNVALIRERPFEILFKYCWPGLMLLKGKWILAALLGVSEKVLGIGPGDIGALIDKVIGKGAGSGNTGPVSLSSLDTAARGLIDRVASGLFSKSSALRADFKQRGVFDAQSLVVAWAHGPDRIERQAVDLGGQIRSFLAMGYRKPGFLGFLSGAVFALLKALLVGLGIHTGISMLLGGSATKTLWDSYPDAGKAPAARPSPGMRLYTNPAGSVEKSLTMALDNAVKDKAGRPFSGLFMDLKGYSPVGSEEMGRVLSEVRAAHGGVSIREINGYRTFAAPPLAEVAKMLLPQATYTKQTASPASRGPDVERERELEGILGGAK